MKQNKIHFTSREIEEFKTFVSQQSVGATKKLSGNQIAKLKKPIFNEYIKKIKYYAKKDINDQRQNNIKKFFGSLATEKGYEQKESPKCIIKKQKPPNNPQTHQPSVYYYGKPQITSMKQFIFLAQQCHRIQNEINRIHKRKQNQFFVKNVEEQVQTPIFLGLKSAKSLNLRLTLKTAKQIDEKLKNKQKSPEKMIAAYSSKTSNRSKSLTSTDFTFLKSKSLASQLFFSPRKPKIS